ncbi:hypothetical protein HY489_02635 [Candidatus Woesearchaeota archaeon]|nr:hypothetical protein [Candidatus Woesearchaeota archaeon]
MANEAYAAAGVHDDLKEGASRIFYEAAKQTWENRKGRLGEVIVPTDSFSGLRAIRVGNLPKGTIMSLGFDGVGTKVELAERLGSHDTVAYDLFAMVCDDAVVRGAEPVLVGSILDVNQLNGPQKNHLNVIAQLAVGYVHAARDAGVAVINGEVAELGARVSGYSGFNYNWGAGLVWFAHEDKMITGKEVVPGDAIVALRENGFRSNGISLVRRTLRDAYGMNWETTLEGAHLGELALTPSVIYSAAVVDMFGGVWDEPRAKLHAVAHITGGGIPEKLKRALQPSGFGATLGGLFEPPQVMKDIHDMARMSEEDAHRTWNMGNGMLLVTPQPEQVIAIAKNRGLEAKVAGEVTRQQGIRIHTYRGALLQFK